MPEVSQRKIVRAKLYINSLVQLCRYLCVFLCLKLVGRPARLCYELMRNNYQKKYLTLDDWV